MGVAAAAATAAIAATATAAGRPFFLITTMLEECYAMGPYEI